MPNSTAMLCQFFPVYMRVSLPYVRNLQIHWALGIQDVVEEIAVIVVTREFRLQGCLKFQRRRSSLQLRMYVLIA